MSPEPAVRWCPHCRGLTQNALAAPPVYDARWSEDPADEDRRVARLRRYCSSCNQVWEAVEAPAELMDDILELPARLEEARRQLAMLRLLLARDRHDAEEAPATIPLRRAA